MVRRSAGIMTVLLISHTLFLPPVKPAGRRRSVGTRRAGAPVSDPARSNPQFVPARGVHAAPRPLGSRGGPGFLLPRFHLDLLTGHEPR
jgi:hypothetical protein